jgi:hypothetical protein
VSREISASSTWLLSSVGSDSSAVGGREEGGEDGVSFLPLPIEQAKVEAAKHRVTVMRGRYLERFFIISSMIVLGRYQ